MKIKNRKKEICCIAVIVFFFSTFSYAEDDSARKVLKQGLVGAGSGALAAQMSGGKAGQGALVGAGTSVIGGALLDALTTPSGTQRRGASPRDEYYYSDQPDEYYVEQPQESGSTKVLKQGLVGAGSGALAAQMSGGKAGQGALIGAGTSVVGGALLDTITQPQQPQKRYIKKKPSAKPIVQKNIPNTIEGGRKKIIRKYDDTGKVVSEEEVYY